jgi:hypothetical protein
MGRPSALPDMATVVRPKNFLLSSFFIYQALAKTTNFLGESVSRTGGKKYLKQTDEKRKEAVSKGQSLFLKKKAERT